MFSARSSHTIVLNSVLTVLVLALFSGNSFAQLSDASGSFNGLLDLVKNSANSWDSRLRGYAISLFWLLASIQFVWTFFPLVFRQSDFGEIVGELIKFVMVIGFFYALLLFSADWGQALVNSFRKAGAHAIGNNETILKPGAVFAEAIELANTIGDVETWNPLTALMISLSAIIVLICFTFIAAFMAVTIVESYIVIHASVLFMGFGGSQWTREYSLAMVRYAVSVGAKLFVLTLIVGVILTSSKAWALAYKTDDTSMWTMVGLSLVCAYLAKTIPELVAGMINGSSMGGGSALGGMAAAGAAGAAAAVATIATAGAAGPAAAGVLGAGGGAAGGTGGGLAGALNSSIAGNAGAAAGTSAAKSGVGATTGGTNAAATMATKVGGNLQPDPVKTPSPQPTSAVQQAAKQASKPSAMQSNTDAEASLGPAAASANPPVTSESTAAALPEAEAPDIKTIPPGASDTSADSDTATPPVAATPPAAATPQASAAPPAAAAPAPNAAPPASAAPPLASAAGTSARIPLEGAQNRGVTGLQFASGAVRAVGIMAAISVPGMESAAGLSLATGATRVDVPPADSDSFDPRTEPENVIRPSKPKGGKP